MKKNALELTEILQAKTPFVIFKKWLKESEKIKGIQNPWAMNFSTSEKGQPSSRIVLLKYLKKEQLIFFTNYTSQKGKHLKKNPKASALFYWESLGKQVRVEGFVKKISRKETLIYWNKRSRESQLSARISKQSQALLSRNHLEDLKHQELEKFKNKKIPCPLDWGGYALFVQKMEFWMDRKHRFHDRVLFKRKAAHWEIFPLFP